MKDFEKQTGIKVNYDVFDSNEVLETKLLAGNTGYDLVVPTANFLERQVKAGVFQKLDKSQLPNLKNVDPDMLKHIELHDPGNEHSVNYLWDTTGSDITSPKSRSACPMRRSTAGGCCMTPQCREIQGLRRVGIRCTFRSRRYGPDLSRQGSPRACRRMIWRQAVLLSIRPYLRYVDSARYIEDLANGETCLALGWSGDVQQARDRAKEAGKGIEIKYAFRGKAPS